MNWFKSIFAEPNPPVPGQQPVAEPDKARTVFIVPDSKLDWLDKKIEGLNKVAKKLGLPPVGYKVLEKNIAQTAVDPEWAAGGQPSSGMVSDIRTATKIEIFGEAPVIKGWKFVARILHDEGGNVLKSVPGEELPPKYRTAEPKCEHCGYKRKRNDTFVLKSVETGEYKQVGSNCLSDFLGHGSPGLYASFAESMADFAEELDAMEGDWEGGRGGGYEKTVDIGYYLKVVYGVMKRHGWLGRAAARDQMKAATADIALNMIFGSRKDPKLRKELDDILQSISADDESMLSDALMWARSLKEGTDDQKDQLSDYYWNLTVACSQDRVKSRTEGIVASLPVAYDKAVLKLIKPDAKNMAGSKGQTVVVKGKIVEEKMFGDNVVYDILTEDNKMVRCTFPAEQQLEGKDVIVEGTVTGYSRKFTYVVTILSRVKFLNADQYPARQQELQKELETKQQGPKPDYQTGQKITTNLTVLKMREVETQYGMTTLVTMVDDFGQTVKWWASNTQDLKEGEKVNVTATVKFLGDYKGSPEVTITRPKINSRAIEEGTADPRLPASEVRAIKKQMKGLELEFNSLCYGYSQADHPNEKGQFPSIDTAGYSAFDPTAREKQKAIESIFPPAFYNAADHNMVTRNELSPDKIFLTDNLEAVVDGFIEACRANVEHNRKTQWEESEYQKTDRYDIESAEREKNSFQAFLTAWTSEYLPKIRELAAKSVSSTSTWAVENILNNLPYEIKRKLQEHDRFFWSTKLRGVEPAQWVDFIQQTVEPMLVEQGKKVEENIQKAWVKMRANHQAVQARIQQEEAELQEVIQNKPNYVQKLQQLINGTPFKAFLLAKPRRQELSKTYQELEQKLSDSAAAVKQYGPLEKKQSNWWIYLKKIGA